jgi:Rrf2 family cysteine metabolism transcriptional repressor
MQFSTKTRYGARALVELAGAWPDRTVSVREMARGQRISHKYLGQIMSALKAAGLIKAVRGVHGGYELARPPAEITLAQVFQVLEGSAAPVECVDKPGSCHLEPLCVTRDCWAEVKAAIENVLDSTNLQELVRRKKAKVAAAGPMYYI